MILLALGTLDILASMTMIFRDQMSMLAAVIGIAMLLKGISSILGSFSSGYYTDLMGAIDLASGISLAYGFSIPFLWALLLLKGILSFSSSKAT